jgi:hypothetical protein
VFLLNSWLNHFTEAGHFSVRLALSRSYSHNLPSSFSAAHPSTLGYSPRLPVSVCGTGTSRLARGFSWQCEIRNFARYSLPITAQRYRKRIFLLPRLTAWACTTNGTLSLSYCVPPLLKRRGGGTGISTCCPSSTPIGLDLGPD